MKIEVTNEIPENYQEVQDVVQKAFENAEHTDHSEQHLVGRLRKSEAFVPELSLVAIDGKKIIGQSMLTKIFIKDDEVAHESLALAPVSVLPEYQSKGIGSRLIKESIEKAKELGFKSVVVLGHDQYYPRFGFKKASSYGIKAPFDVPDSAFMVLELVEGGLRGVEGIVEYSSAFFE